MATTTDRIHPWEKTGRLGKAPYTWLGVDELRGPIRTTLPDGVVLEQGSPGQPMGSCAYCGQGIAERHHIRSADGVQFTVGCDCVRKTHHAGERVLATAERAARDLRNAKARERNARTAKESKVAIEKLLADEAVRTRLAAQPSRHEWKRVQGGTRLEDVEWLARNAGHTGRQKLLKNLAAEGLDLEKRRPR